MLLKRLARAELHGKIQGVHQVSEIIRVRKVVGLYVGRLVWVPRSEADGAAALWMQQARHDAKSVLKRYLVVPRLLKV